MVWFGVALRSHVIEMVRSAVESSADVVFGIAGLVAIVVDAGVGAVL